jgi:hypothetical protein
MAAWQYNFPGETAPVVGTDQGYYVNHPNVPTRYTANADNSIGYLEDQDGKRLHLWITDIEMNFQVSGQYAQSHRYRQWYPRNFVQPRVMIQGQVANEADYGNLAEFIRITQRKALRWASADDHMWSTNLHISSGGIQNHRRQGHSLNGHILNIQRTAERWVNAPTFQFEFVVVTAAAGLYHTQSTDASGAKNKIAKYMDPMAQQVNNTARNGQSIDWIRDPDNGPAGQGGSGVAGYSKGEGKPD